MQSAPQHEPLAQGRLEGQPFAHILLFLYQKKLSGTLVIRPDGAESRVGIKVVDGRVQGAQLPSQDTKLEAGLLPLCGLGAASFGFYEADFLAESTTLVTGSIDPYTLLSRSIHDHPRDDMVDALLARYGETALRMRPNQDLQRLRLESDQGVLVELLRAAPASVADLVRDTPMPAERTRRTLYVLLTTRVAEPFQERQDATFSSQTRLGAVSAPPSRPMSARPTAQDSGVRTRSSTSTAPKPGAPPRTSHAPAARPSQGPKPRTSSAPGARTSLPPEVRHSQRPAAWKVLAARASMAPGAPSSQSAIMAKSGPAPGLGPAERLARAKELAKNGKLEDAVGTMRALLEEYPDNPDYLAVHGWALHRHARSLSHDEVPKAAVNAIRQALSIDPEQPMALYTKGLFYKHGDRLRDAYNCFRRAARNDPKLLEAQREVQILRRRLDAGAGK